MPTTYKTLLKRSIKEDRDQLRSLDVIFNLDVPRRDDSEGFALIRVSAKDKEKFLKWCYERKIVLSECKGDESVEVRQN